jgi:hypothetical protein
MSFRLVTKHKTCLLLTTIYFSFVVQFEQYKCLLVHQTKVQIKKPFKFDKQKNNVLEFEGF